MTTPGVADPVDGFGQAEAIERLFGGDNELLEGEIARHGLALAVRRPVDGVHGAVAGQDVDQRTPGA